MSEQAGHRPLTTADFDYDLPPELIAQYPPAQRGASRLLVMDSSTGRCEDRQFRELPELLKAGDCLVFNDSKVFAARLFGRKMGGSARIEALLLREHAEGVWQVMLRPGKRVKPGTRVAVEGDDHATYEILSHEEDGTFRIAFNLQDVQPLLARCGHLPLPPYIDREDEPLDHERYQTVYAKRTGSVAAPTAGLHFTREILDDLAARGVQQVAVTLHVGPGTFQPVSASRIEDHEMHEEIFELSPEAAATINRTKAAGGRVLAVGTTSVRVLESCVDADGQLAPGTGSTRLFIYPPYQPRIPDGLLTNFHLPKSTLLMLVACFSTRERLLAAYEWARNRQYRFYSYGDCMLTINQPFKP